MINKNLLKEFQDQSVLVAIYSDCNNTDKFSVGKILGVDDDFVLLGCVTPTGAYDGFAILRIDHCILAERDTQYLKKMKTLCTLKNMQWKKVIIQNNVVDEMLKYAAEQKCCVNIELCDSGFYDVQGIVSFMDTEGLTIDKLTDIGMSDGVAYVPRHLMTKITVDSVEEQMVELLYNNLNKTIKE